MRRLKNGNGDSGSGATSHDTGASSSIAKVGEPDLELGRAFRRFLKKVPDGIKVSIQKTATTGKIELALTDIQLANLQASPNPRIFLQRGDDNELKVYKVNPPAPKEPMEESKQADSTNGTHKSRSRKKRRKSF